jgi:superfamily II DNA helicase RecQ
VSDIRIGIQYGVPSSIPTLDQRKGRIGRNSDNAAIFLLMYEDWVTKIDLPQTSADVQDPDQPFVMLKNTSTGNTLNKRSSKKDRVALAVLELVLLREGISKRCTRKFLARYMGDTSLQGNLLFVSSSISLLP